jgi:hypothetical protein
VSSSGAHKRQRGAPVFAESQRSEILEMLRAAGPIGGEKSELVFSKHWTQCAARIHELEQMGYKIALVQCPGDRLIRFVLESEPLALESVTVSDWYERVTGKPRPPDDSTIVSELPPFSGIKSDAKIAVV